MPSPSKLAIATSAVQRLIKEEASYHKEIDQQKARIQKLETSGASENLEYELKQEKQALAETETVLVSMKGRIQKAIEQLDEQLENSSAGSDVSTEDVAKATEVITEAKKTIENET